MSYKNSLLFAFCSVFWILFNISFASDCNQGKGEKEVKSTSKSAKKNKEETKSKK